MVRNTSGKKYHDKRRCRLQDSIEINFGEMCVYVGVSCIYSVGRLCDECVEFSGSVRMESYLYIWITLLCS
jgi:hypothetical protein